MPNTREKLIELLDNFMQPGKQNTLGEFADHLIANGVTISNLETVKEWIPVSERLPEKDVKVLTFGVYGFSVNYRDRFSGKWRGVNGKPQWITHWMPLPNPPKGE